MSPTQRGITTDRMTTDPGWAGWKHESKSPWRWLIRKLFG